MIVDFVADVPSSLGIDASGEEISAPAFSEGDRLVGPVVGVNESFLILQLSIVTGEIEIWIPRASVWLSPEGSPKTSQEASGN